MGRAVGRRGRLLGVVGIGRAVERRGRLLGVVGMVGQSGGGAHY